MLARQEVMNVVGQLSDEQLRKVLDYIRLTFFTPEESEPGSDEEQKTLLDLLDHTVDTGRGDFSEKHDDYLYGRHMNNEKADIHGHGFSDSGH